MFREARNATSVFINFVKNELFSKHMGIKIDSRFRFDFDCFATMLEKKKKFWLSFEFSLAQICVLPKNAKTIIKMPLKLVRDVLLIEEKR